MTHEEFVSDWTLRYATDTCTEDHLWRLQKIGRLSKEEVVSILASKPSTNVRRRSVDNEENI